MSYQPASGSTVAQAGKAFFFAQKTSDPCADTAASIDPKASGWRRCGEAKVFWSFFSKKDCLLSGRQPQGWLASHGQSTLLVAATLATSVACAQSPTVDPTPLPAMTGKVAQFTLTPRGDVDGLILDDGTEVQVSPHASLELVFAVRPGDVVTIHGLRAHAIPMIHAMSVTNDATHMTVATQGRRGDRDREDAIEDHGRIKAQLHDLDGGVDGVLLEDGTAVDLPDPEAVRLRAQLAVGHEVYVRGAGTANALGRTIAARFIGPDKESAVEIQGASEDDERGHGRHGHGGHGRGDPDDR